MMEHKTIRINEAKYQGYYGISKDEIKELNPRASDHEIDIIYNTMNINPENYRHLQGLSFDEIKEFEPNLSDKDIEKIIKYLENENIAK